MIVTVTNDSGGEINALDTIDLGTFGTAVGGARKTPLPYPFGHIGALANAASSALPMQNRDWHHKAVPWLPMTPSIEWQQMVQAGIVSLASAAETDDVDVENAHIVANV